MTLPVIATVQLARFSPSTNALGEDVAGWSTASPVDTFGWWPPSADGLSVEVGRRAVEATRELLVPAGTVCGDRDRWTLPDGRFEQVGAPQDYSHGPFGVQTPLVVWLKDWEG